MLAKQLSAYLTGLIIAMLPFSLYAKDASPTIIMPGAIKITTVGSPKNIYKWETDRCENDFLPDAPIRAFHRADGKLDVLATHDVNWSLVGQDFSSLKPVCKSVMQSDAYKSQRAGALWIEATFTNDGREVTALVSQDMTSVMKSQGCHTNAIPGRCWLNDIVAARSHDMGKSFSLLDRPNRSVATLSSTYPNAATGRFGIFTTTNIVEKEKSYYTMAWIEASGNQKNGSCLFKNDDPTNTGSWRAWDGVGFNLDMRAPVINHPCVTLDLAGLPGPVRSLLFDVKHKLWIAVFSGRKKLAGEDHPVSGAYYSSSRDLFSWSSPTLIMAAPTIPRQSGLDYFINYPAMIDPGSRSRNFNTIDTENPILTFTKSHLKDGQGTLDRDLQFIQLKID